MERGSVNGKTSVGAPSHSRTPGQTTSNLIMCPGPGTGVRLRPALTITKVVIPANYIQGRASRIPIRAIMLQLSGKNMLMAAITTMDIRSSYQKKECQGERVLLSGMKITEIKRTSVTITVKTSAVLLERVMRPSSDRRVGTLIKTVPLLTPDRRGLGTCSQRVC